MASPVQTILIVGASYGGLSAAHYLLQHGLPPTHQIILLSSSTVTYNRPASPRALLSSTFFPQDKLFVPIAPLLTRYPSSQLCFIHGTITTLSLANRTATYASHPSGSTQHLTFNYAIIATGASTPSPLLSLPSFADADILRSEWETFRSALPHAKNIIISGGGPSAVEVAGELGEYLNGRPSWIPFVKKERRVKITIVTSSERVLPHLREDVSAQAAGYLSQLGVDVITGNKVVGVTPEGAEVGDKVEVKFGDGTVMQADLYIPCVGTKPNTGFIEEKEVLGGDGRIEVDAMFRVKGHKGVYATGDVCAGVTPAIHVVLKAVPVLGRNVLKGLEEEGAGEEFAEDKRMTQLVPVGRSKGVGMAMGWKVPSWAVWLIKGRDYWLWTTGDLWSGKQWEKE
ncbi:hypothetical protein OQA88_1107 [Cercophora sp. LCS_1]